MTVEVRLVEGDERLSTARPLTSYAFEASPATEDPDRAWRRLDAGVRRTHVLFDDGEPRATAGVWAMTQNVRGALLPMGGVAGVATHPAARRAGHARRLLTHALADMREQGQTVSTLYPFRPSFYEKFGYVPLGADRHALLRPADLMPLLRAELPGTVTLFPLPEVAERVRRLTEAVQSDTHGMALRVDPDLREYALLGDWWAAVCTVDGEVTGFLTYQVKEYGGELAVARFLYRDPTARALLLGWLARHTDQVATVRLPLRPADRPEHWVTDVDVRMESRAAPLHSPAPMARILSVPGLAGIGCGAGEITVEVTDTLIGGVYTLSGDGTLSVKDGGGTPVASLTGHGLAALVYGTLDPAELPLRGYGSVPPPAAATLRALFPPAIPFLLEHF